MTGKTFLFGCFLGTVLMTGCATSEGAASSNEINGEFLVQLREVGDIKEVVSDLKKLKLSLIRSIAPTMNIWLVRSAHKKMSSQKLLEKIKAHPMVVEAEVNKRLDNRGE